MRAVADQSAGVFRFTVSVRRLAEFVHRRGDLACETDFVSSSRALEGIRAHQRWQRAQPEGYQAEVRVSSVLSEPDLTLVVQGRVDGLRAEPGRMLLEEIKTVTRSWNGQPDPVHWAQARLYAHLFLATLSSQLSTPAAIELRLVYLNLDTGEDMVRSEVWTPEALVAFWQQTMEAYLDGLRRYVGWLQVRNHSITASGFPFATYREGQRRLAVAAYRALKGGRRLLAEAPTGIGKTISTLFPAAKVLAEGGLERVFYLTAKTSGQTAAAQALEDLRRAGMRLRGLVLTAREKICFRTERPGACAGCAWGTGYYDRNRTALAQLLEGEEIDRQAIEAVARRHEVCPFELALEAAPWVDVVRCDYNYIFDPEARLRRLLDDEGGGRFALLVDEAHNLVDRGRDMFSATLDQAALLEGRRALQKSHPPCAQALGRLSRRLTQWRQAAPVGTNETGSVPLDAAADPVQADLFKDDGTESASASHSAEAAQALWREPCLREGDGMAYGGCPEDLPPLLEKAVQALEAWLARNEEAPCREAITQLYFDLRGLQRRAAADDGAGGYAWLLQGRPPELHVRFLCLDPAALLGKVLQKAQAALFFSATLTPLDYYRDLLGGGEGDTLLRLLSPFPASHWRVLVQDRVDTRYKVRAASCDPVAEAVAALVAARPGHYLVFFPSYAYLEAVWERLRPRAGGWDVRAQKSAMTDAERAAFLEAFQAEPGRMLVGLAVLGGVFGEGIDLPGERLIGTVLVGVGLPQVGLERELIRRHFQAARGKGFEYAYLYPGLNRVVQAAGRVIRSEQDRGMALLLDTRYGERRYRELLPASWQMRRASTPAAIVAEARAFWRE